MRPTTCRPHLAVARLGALVAAVLLVLASACSSSGTATSSSGSDSSSAAASSGSSSSVSSDTGSASSDTGSGSSKVTRSDLEALLPAPSQVGSDYTVDTSSSDSSSSSGSSDSLEADAEKQCPELAALSSNQVPDSSKAIRSYTAADSSSIEVSLNPKARQLSDRELDKDIEAINACGEIDITVKGQDEKIRFSVKRDGSRGDQSIRIDVTIKLAIAQLNKAFTVKFVGFGYRIGGVGVTVSALGGIDEQTLEVAPPDEKTAASLADELEPKVRKLVEG